MNFDLKFYIAIILRRTPIILAIVVITSLIGLKAAYDMPPVFRAEARLLIESPQIPDELAASTVRTTVDEILLSIQQRLLTRVNLLDLSRQFGVHDTYPDWSEDSIVNDMRRRILLSLPPTQQTSGAVTVSFDATNAEQSASVTNALVAQILEQAVSLRTSVSGDTLDFFQQEVKRLSEEMSAQNGKILKFKQANRDALPESLDYRRSRQSAEQERLLQVDRELAGLRDRRQRLTDLFDRTGRLAPSVGDMTPEQAELEQLRQQLASALVIYSPTAPRVRGLQTQVAALEEVVKQQLGAGEGEGALSTFDVQMADIDGQIAFLAEQKEIIEREIKTIDVSVEATPKNAIALGELESDYENLTVQHNQAVASLAEARMGDRIEVTARGQRITVIEPASVPTAPSAPNRKLIAATGFGAGVVLAAALIFLLELLNKTIRRPVELVGALGITPFATIPYLTTQAELRRRRLKIFGLPVLAILIGGPVLLYLTDAYVMPIGDLFGSIGETVGLVPPNQLTPAPNE